MAYHHENITDVKREVIAYLDNKEFDLRLLVRIYMNDYPKGNDLKDILDLFWSSYLADSEERTEELNNSLRSLL